MTDSKEKSRSKLDPEFEEQLREKSATLKDLVDAGDFPAAMRQINDLCEVRDQSLYREVGRLTRTLHESIRNFHIDAHNLEQQAELSKMADASDRLKYVIDMTGRSANRTMDLVEATMPLATALREEAAAISEDWQRLRRREMEPAEFRELYKRVDGFLGQLTTDADTVYGNLSEILLAQDYQDLTGQVIQRVTTLVREVEDNLVQLVVMASNVDNITGTVHDIDNDNKDEDGIRAEGPQLHVEGRTDVVSGQDEVDDLLSSLGF
ncbi:protein phosphatase CheZ [Mangrovitalea sediminis]|uniref:protein phosphatase CheZ n=1 Tax=Mangrovitalea sediminis TaxID=1982043 RepID=UPI000BE543A3|nr:protein phosphatase CheZ [Mangrovitalea sediminis]